MGNWDKKDLLTERAKRHTEEMARKYRSEIEHSVALSHIYAMNNAEKTTESNITISVIDADSVSAAMKADGRICILNFASYKYPGGMFLKGSKAQEECLCHESFLYNVLSCFPDYYERNLKNLNRALYKNRAIYSPDVLFFHDGEKKFCDVLTCAAPNFTTASKYQKVTPEENRKVLQDRIHFILSILSENKPDTAILGAFGCGVFGQNPYEVAEIFKNEIEKGICMPMNLVFAIPDGANGNLKAFKEVFGN